MKKQLLFIISLTIGSLCAILMTGTANAQTKFQKKYSVPGNQQEARFVQQTNDGGYIIAGVYNFFNNNSGIYLIKTDFAGNPQWTKTYSDINSHALANSVQQTYDGGYIVGGEASFTYPIWGVCGYLLKVDANGTLEFSKSIGTYNGSGLGCVAKQTIDSGYIVTGPFNASRFNSMIASNDIIYLTKFDASGGIVWSKKFGTGYKEANSVEQTTDGGYIIAGRTGTNGVGYILIIKTDINGVIVWAKTYGSQGYAQANSIQQTTDGGYIVGVGFQAGGQGCYVLKLDSIGNISWANSYSNVGCHTIRQTNDGGYIIGGGIGYNSSDFTLLKLYSNGIVNWQKSYGKLGINDYYYGNCAQETFDGGYIIVGETDTTGETGWGEAVYIIKTDSLGISGCNENNDTSIVIALNLDTNSISLTTTSGISVINDTLPATNISTIIDVSCLSIGINEIEDIQFTFIIYPNPSTNIITIATTGLTGETFASIYNIQGQLLLQQFIHQAREEINISSLAYGVYIIKVNSVDGIAVRKFIKK